MNRLITLLVLLAFALTQDYLPKEGPVPIYDIFATDVARTGKHDFWKDERNGWSHLYSVLPIRPNTVTKVTFYLVAGNDFIIGVGVNNRDKVNTGSIRTAYDGTATGYKGLTRDRNHYGSSAIIWVLLIVASIIGRVKYTSSLR